MYSVHKNLITQLLNGTLPDAALFVNRAAAGYRQRHGCDPTTLRVSRNVWDHIRHAAEPHLFVPGPTEADDQFMGVKVEQIEEPDVLEVR